MSVPIQYRYRYGDGPKHGQEGVDVYGYVSDGYWPSPMGRQALEVAYYVNEQVTLTEEESMPIVMAADLGRILTA